MEQIKSHLARIRTLGQQWAFDDMHRRLDEMHARNQELARRAPSGGFQPTQPAPFQPPQSQPPQFQPPTMPRPSIPRPSGAGMRPSLPRHRFGR